MTVDEPGEKKRNTNNKGNDGIGENKGDDTEGETGKNIKREIKRNIGGRINGGLLFKKKKNIISFFLGRLRFRSFLPLLRRVILSVKAIKLKKRLIKNKIKIYNNATRVRPKYANKIKYQNNI